MGLFVSFNRNYYNFIQHQIGKPVEAKVQPELDSIPINAQAFKAPLPSQLVPKGSLLTLWEHIINLIRKIWPSFLESPHSIDFRLFEDLLLSSTGRKLSGSNTSSVLRYLHTFLSNEKDVPPNVLKELNQARQWAEKIESATAHPLQQNRLQQLSSLSTSIIEAIKLLKNGESCLIPGGLHEASALYRVTYNGTFYTLEFISNDAHLQQSDSISIAGKDKMRTKTIFTPLMQEQLTDKSWWEAVLSLQSKKKFEQTPSRDGLTALLARFAPHKKVVQDEVFHKSHHGLSRFQTVWNAVHDKMASSPENDVKKARRKLRLGLDALFRFVATVEGKLNQSKLAQGYIEEATKRLSQKTLHLYRQGHIKQEESDWIQKELNAIQTRLHISQFPPTPSAKQHTVAGPHVSLKKECKVTLPKAFQWRMDKPSKSNSAENAPEEGLPALNEAFTLKPRAIPDFAPGTIMQAIGEISKTLENPDLNNDPISLQHWIIDIAFALPLDKYKVSIWPEISYGKDNPDDRWQKLSQQERIAVSEVLLVLAKKLAASSNQTNTKLPDRIFALVKLETVMEHLATLNDSLTGIAKYNQYLKLDSIFDHIVHGGNGTKTMYRRKSQREKNVIDDIERYHRLFKDLWVQRSTPKPSILKSDSFFTAVETGEIPRVPQINHLYEFLITFKNTLEPNIQNWISWYTARKIDEWGRPIEDQRLAGATYAVSIAQGIHKDPNAGGWFSSGNPWFTQEAIIDNPEKVLDRAVQRWLEEAQSSTSDKLPKKVVRQSLKVDELRAILLTLHRSVALWNIMGLIETHPELLQHSDICSLFELMFLDNESIRITLGRDHAFIPYFNDFLVRHIAAYRKKEQIEPALFLMHLSHSLTIALDKINEMTHVRSKKYSSDVNPPLLPWQSKDELEPVPGAEEPDPVNDFRDTIEGKRKLPKLKKAPEELPNFEQTIYEWTLDALQEHSKIKSYSHALLTEYLFLLNDKQTLNVRELGNLVIFYFFFNNQPIDPRFYDPVTMDQVHKNFLAWTPIISELFQKHPALLQDVLTRVSELLGEKASNERWKGTFPIYRSASLILDLSKGVIQKVDEAGYTDHLPATMLRDPAFQTAFPVSVAKQPLAKRAILDNGEVFIFKDPQGQECRVEVCNSSLTLYKQHPQDDSFLQFIDRSDLVFKNGMPPEAVLKLSLFVSIKNPSELYAFSQDGFPAFHCHLNSSGAMVVADLRPGMDQHKGWTATHLNTDAHPELAFLRNVVPEDRILLWSHNQELKEIELVDYGLQFKYDQAHYVCISEPYKGYHLDLTPGQQTSRGLPSSLTLIPPNAEQMTKVLIPPHSGHFVRQYNPYSTSANKLVQFLKDLWYALSTTPLEHAERHNGTFSWMPQPTQGKPQWYVLEQDSTAQKLIPQSGQSVLQVQCDVVKYALQMLALYPQISQTTLDNALLELSKLSSHLFVEDFVVKTLQDLQSIFAQKQLLRHRNTPPEAWGYYLRALLLLRSKADERLHATIDQKIGAIAPHYFASGKHMDVMATMTTAEIHRVVQICKTTNREFYAEHAAPLLAEKNTTQEMALSPKHFFPLRDQPFPLKSILTELLSSLKENHPLDIQNLYLNRDPLALIHSFKKLYKVACGLPSDESFKNYHLTLKALASDTLQNDDIAITLHFFEAIFDVKAHHAEVILPTLPDIKYPAIPEKASDEVEKTVIEQQQQNDAAFEKFFGELAAIVTKHYPLIAKNHADPSPAVEVQRRSLEQRLEETAKAIKEEAIPIDLLDVKELEKRLATAKEQPLSTSILQTQPAEQLFTEEELKDYFSNEQVTQPLVIAEFIALLKHPEACVRLAAQAKLKEIEAYNTQVKAGTIKKRTFKNEQALVSVQQHVETKIKKFDKDLIVQKEAILKLISPPQTSLAQMEAHAGYRHQVTWDELYLAYLQGDFNKLALKLGTHVNRDELHKAFCAYCKLEVSTKFLRMAQDELENIRKEKLWSSPSSVEKALDYLHRCRGFNSEAHPNILVVEALLGFVLTEEQLEIVWGFIQDPSAIRRAITGAGKTTVILFLTGLLKANGNNLVTLKFLDPLFAENFKRLQKNLGGVFKKMVTPLLFNMQTPLVKKKKVNGEMVEESAFKGMYEKCLATILNKGCVVSNRRSFPLLEAKLIAMLYRFANLPEDEIVEKVEWEHLEWLSKLVLLIRQHEEDLKDEHDKFLAPKEEIHLRLSGHLRNPGFVWETITNIYNQLLNDPKLELSKNTQAEGPISKRETALKLAAQKLAQEWQKKHALDDKQTEGLRLYFAGDSEEILPFLESKCTPKELDTIALTKDMLVLFLPLILGKTADQKYILSKDHIHVIPADYTNRPREGSEQEDIRERTSYMIQYYHQFGVSFEYFKDWLDTLRNDGLKEIDKGTAKNLTETQAEQLFQSYFPDESLSSLFAHDYERLHHTIKGNPALTNKFLELLLPKLLISGRKITIDALNQVSMSKQSAGTSATKGCEEGYHQQFHFEKEDKKQINARMLARFVQRTSAHKPLQYDPANPQNIIPSLIDKDPTLRVVIDGAGALWKVESAEAAAQLQQKTQEPAIGYFDPKGNLAYVGNEQATLDQRGHLYSHDQARGADVVLSVSKPAVLLANGRSPLEEVSQNEGRLRKEDQPLRIAVPQESSIDSVNTLLGVCLETEARDHSDNLLRSKKQEPRDHVRRNMLDNLLNQLVNKNFEDAFAQFRNYQEDEILVTETQEKQWTVEGEYYKKNKHIQKQNQKPVQVLTDLNRHYKAIAQKHRLREAIQKIDAADYQAILDKLPENVYGCDATALGREVEIETEQAVEATTEVSVEMESEVATTVEKADEMPFYIGWRGNGNSRYRVHNYRDALHPAYDPEITFTENYLPLYRNTYTTRVYHRQPHDLKQNPLHFIQIGPEKVMALDEIDAVHCIDPMYDTKLRRLVDFDGKGIFKSVVNRLPQLLRLFVQMRFEDGQASGYPPEELELLKKWLSEQKDPGDLERYFVNEVLRHRPEDKASYPFSQLHTLFRQVCTNHHRATENT